MILHYKFEYFSNNNLLLQCLTNCAKEFELEYKLVRDDKKINLYVKAKNIEIIEEFSNFLSSNIPQSIFLGKIEIEVLEKIPEVQNTNFESCKMPTFSHKCLVEVENINSKNYKNPFIDSEDLGNNLQNKSFIFEVEGKEITKNSNIEYIKEVAKLLNDGKLVKIKTLSGEFVFSKFTKVFQYNKEKLKLLSTNLSQIQRVLEVSQEELVALSSIEKPIIEVKLKDNYEIVSRDKTVEIRYVNDLILYLLGVELKEYEIDLLVQKEDSNKFDSILTFETSNNFKCINIPKVAITPSARALMIENSNYNKNLDKVYSGFKEKEKAQFMTILSENNLFEKSILNFYCSSSHSNGALIYSAKHDGLLDYFTYNIPNKIGDIFEQIQNSDAGKRLINNYKEKFPELYETSKNMKIDSDKESISSLWDCAKVVLGFENSVLSLVAEESTNKGPRVDYKFLKSNDEKIYNKKFDCAKFIQSLISFKLAGVANSLLAMGIVDSYVDFISLICDNVQDNIGIDGVSFCGDLISNKLILELINKNISINHKIYYNKDFPIQINE